MGQIKITLTDGEEEFVRNISEQSQCSLSDVVRTAFVFGVPKLLEYLDLIGPNDQLALIEDIVIRLALGEVIEEAELNKIANNKKAAHEPQELAEALRKLQVLIKRRNGNGCPTSV